MQTVNIFTLMPTKYKISVAVFLLTVASIVFGIIKSRLAKFDFEGEEDFFKNSKNKIDRFKK